MPYEDKLDWILNNVGVSREEAANIVNSMEYYSSTGYQTMHWDENAQSPHTQNILKVFDSNAPRYSGVTYRGLSFNSKEELYGVLKQSENGWNEPGLTSFSTDPQIADGFASQGKYGLVLTSRNGHSGIPFSHMSHLSYEHEVLYPGSLRGNSWQMDLGSAFFDKDKKILYIDIIERS